MKTTITKRIKHLVLAMFASLLLIPTIAVAQIITPTTGDFATDQKDTWIDVGVSMSLLESANLKACLLKQTGAHLVVNGTYNALVDFSLCIVGISEPIITNLTVKTSRANNSSSQVTDMWFKIRDTPILFQAIVKEEVSNTAPFGSSTMKWTDISSNPAKGTLLFTAGATHTGVSYVDNIEGLHHWMVAEIKNSDGKTGIAKTSMQAQDAGTGIITTDIFRVNFNQNLVHQDKNAGTTNTCSDRTSFAEVINDYDLYNPETGERKELSGGFSCTYASGTRHCFITKSGYWLEGGETGANRPTRVTDMNGVVYSGITYDGVNYVVNVPGYIFDQPLVFNRQDQSSAVQAAMKAEVPRFTYNGMYMLGLQQVCTEVSPGVTECSGYKVLPDGTVLIDKNNTKYVLKASMSTKTMHAAADINACASLALSDADRLLALTVNDIQDVTIRWSDKPVVTDAPKVINGELQ